MGEILTVPNPILLQKASRVREIDEEIENLVEKMQHLVEFSEGRVGLAAPQIGVLKRIFLIKPSQGLPIQIFINPKLVWVSSERTHTPVKEAREGCLSVPEVSKIIDRHKSIRVVYQALNGYSKEERFDGWAARIIQHENDHLNGVLITSPRI